MDHKHSKSDQIPAASKSSDSLASAVLAALEEFERPQRAQAIARAAEFAEPDDLIELMSDQYDSRRRNAAMEALSRSGARSIPALLRALRDKDSEVVLFAANVLGRTRDPAAIPHLVGLLDHEDANVAQAAIDSLAQLQATVAVDSLVNILDRDPWLRFAAVHALGEIGDPKSVEPLASLLDDDSIRLGAIEALGKIGSPQALGHLARLLRENGDSATFAACLRAIGQALESQPDEQALHSIEHWAQLGTPAAAGLQARLGQVLSSTEENECSGDQGPSKKEAGAQLVRALRLRPLYTTLVLAGRDPKLRDVLEFCAVSIGRDIAPALSVGLGCNNRSVRLLVCRCIGALGMTDLVPGMVALLGDGAETVRVAAVQALACLGHSGSAPALARLLGDPSTVVRDVVVGALARLDAAAVSAALLQACASNPGLRPQALDIMRLNPHPSQLPFVKSCLCDTDAAVRARAVGTATAHLGAKAVDFLEPLLSEPDVTIRRSIVAALGQMRSAAITQILLRQIEIDPETRREAIRALVTLGDATVAPRVVEILKREEGALRIPLIEALAQIGDPVAEPTLIRLLANEDSAVRRAAVLALGRFGSRVALRHIVAAARDSDSQVRMAVVAALSQNADPLAQTVLERLAADSEEDVSRAARLHLDP